MRLTTPGLILLLSLRPIQALTPTAPMTCAAGAPLGRIELTVSQSSGGTPRPFQTINRLLPGYKISYHPEEIDGPDKKKARVALLLVPSEGSKITVFDPHPANQPVEWIVPARTQIAGLVWGPDGLDKAKVNHLVAKNDELIGQLADYAAKTQETQALIAAITQQQALATGQNVDAAVAGFANTYSVAPKLDSTQPTNAQMLTLIKGVNPALSAYDPLAQNPQQRAAQTAGLVAAVAGLFFGNGVGLAAEGGAVLVNMHSLIFPNTEFRSALAQNFAAAAPGDTKTALGLCGNKTPSASRTELAFLWASRIPDASAPEIKLAKTENLPIGIESSVAIEVHGVKDPKLAARVDGWKLLSEAGKASVPLTAKVSPDAKTVALDLKSEKLKPGPWKLAANWDWDPVGISGEIVLHPFSKFDTARLAPQSQDKLTPAAGLERLELTGSDFEFVRKLAYKKSGDPFAQPSTLPFRLPDGPDKSPAMRLETQLDARPLTPGNYAFLIAQSDDQTHEVPFKVLPAPPEISGLPLRANTGLDSQVLELHGTGLDRLEQLSTEGAEITLGDASQGDKRKITIKLAPAVTAGKHLTLTLKVKDVAEPVVLSDAILVAGPKPVISGVRKSIPGDLGITLLPDEIPASTFVSFAIDVAHAPYIAGVSLSCGAQPLKLRNGESTDSGRLNQESPGALFMSFNPQKVGQPGCVVLARLMTPEGEESEPHRLGTIVGLPKIDAFQLTDEKVGATSYAGTLKGRDLETIDKVGWDAQTGVAVDAIPAPVAGNTTGEESLRIIVPWPAPGPHAPLYVWLRGETTGRLTTAIY